MIVCLDLRRHGVGDEDGDVGSSYPAVEEKYERYRSTTALKYDGQSNGTKNKEKNTRAKKEALTGNAKSKRPIDFYGEFCAATSPQQLVAERDDLPLERNPYFAPTSHANHNHVPGHG